MNIFLSVFLTELISQADSPEKAKAYLKEVRKHLLESFIEREKLTSEELATAAKRGVREVLRADASGKALASSVESGDTLNEVFDRLEKASQEYDVPLDWIALADGAARSMVEETGDPFSRILTAKDFKRLQKLLLSPSREEGLGIVAQVRDGCARVHYVQVGTPAFEEGIEIGDRIVTVDGKSADDMTSEELNERFMIGPGRSLDVTLRKEGHPREYVFRLTAHDHERQDALYAMMGEGIAYLRLAVFGMTLTREVKQALKELREEGMRALVLDLRHNPGGALPVATGVADLFLPQGLIITRTEQFLVPSFAGIELPGFGGSQTIRSRVRFDCEDLPMILLVDEATASASELLAGALQDHGRARVIGRTTYGKGVGQTPIPLQSMRGERYLYLTVMRYALPSGRSIHHKGVVPEINCTSSQKTPEQFDRVYELRRSGGLERYLDRYWDEHEERFEALAGNDGFETSRYPDFEEFFSSLKASLTRDETREELRRAIRQRLAAKQNTHYAYDLETDTPLQLALVELLDQDR